MRGDGKVGISRSSMVTTDLVHAKGLPANLDAERFVLGSILLNGNLYLQVASTVAPEDFSLKAPAHFCAHEGSIRSRRENRPRDGGR